jgi:hypothetical protein
MCISSPQECWRAPLVRLDLITLILFGEGCKLLNSALMMEAVSTCETLVNLYETTRQNNAEDSRFRNYVVFPNLLSCIM